MKNGLVQQIAKFIKEHRLKKQWQMAVTVLAAVVVFTTTYSLILPAITMSNDTYTASNCQTGSNGERESKSGRKESGSNAYDSEATSSNAYNSEATSSNATIYYCGFEAHTHDKHCYDDEGNLTCELTVHVHTEECLVEFTEEELAMIQNVIDMIAKLPTSEEVETKLAAFEEEGDKDGFEAYVKTIAEIAWPAYEAYEALSDELKAQVTNLDLLMNLEWLWSATVLFEYPSLEGDGAYVSKLKETTSKVIAESEDESADPMTVANGNSVEYQFSIETDSYSDMYYSEGRVKVEFVLPFAAEQAEFDLAEMNWLDNSDGYETEITTEERTIDGETMDCQVLTGYKHFAAEDAAENVIPGQFKGNVVVSVNEMAHGEKIAILISAAMEDNEWNGECTEHGREEKLTIATNEYTVYAPLSPEEQKAIYEAFLTEVEETEANGLLTEELRAVAEELLQRVQEAYAKGEISEEHYSELSERLKALLNVENVETIAEQAIGENWLKLEESGWFENFAECEEIESAEKNEAVVVASPMMFRARAMLANIGDEKNPSDEQIDEVGGSNSDDNVTVSKTIDGTDIENVFDITLKVQTETKISEVYKEPDMAVVIVMDISQTMNSKFPAGSDTTRYTAAMDSAKEFIKTFATETGGVSKLGYVAFNTSAFKVFDLKPCSTTQEMSTLIDELIDGTEPIITDSGYKDSHERFTNVEAGLKLAKDMLADVTNENKYIIFLSDGFPTTYVKKGYTGYDPYCTSGTPGEDGVFYDQVLGVYTDYGTSYSDKAAIRAREMATSMKNAGVKIFSIGVDVGGQTIKSYVDSSEKEQTDGDGAYFSIVDRTGTTYEIGAADSTSAYKDWLKNKIGSGYYYDSTDAEGLKEAYQEIFAKIREINRASSEAEWVALDPMPKEEGEDGSVYDSIEFIGFYDQKSTLITDIESGLSGENVSDGENTALFSTANQEIRWDLKNSGYTSDENDGVTTYSYQLVYRVRLKNELDEFQEGIIYDTNNPTNLTYKIIEEKNDDLVKSEQKTIGFPIPAVHGYLGELTFTKIDSFEKPVVGAEFTLSHDTTACSICRGDGSNHVVISNNDPFNVATEAAKATSDSDGNVSFERIPSGHTYTLVETKVPAGYSPTDKSYQVVVAYNATTVNVKDADGNSVDWDGNIVNPTSYELPQTGGLGTTPFIFTGITMIISAMGYVLLSKKRKFRKEDNTLA